MNIYELEKQATPGPWGVERDPGGGVSGMFPTNILTGDNNTVEVASMIDSEKDAKLATHCRNNFMRALEALKGCVEEMGHTLPYSFAPNGMDALIAELEEVKP